MKILAIETSCDETAIAIIDWSKRTSAIKIMANLISSQIEIHKPFGGVVPNLARREHEKNLVPILLEALKKAKMFNMESGISNLENKKSGPSNSKFQILNSILEREPILLDSFIKNITPITIPKIDAIAVTYGPGLAPALWVGLNFAKALSFVWKKPLIPVNHMEGHIFSALLKEKHKPRRHQLKINSGVGAPTETSELQTIKFPAIALLVSGGHTEIILINKLGVYKIIGETIDDASGEAFDKVARILELPYPGGPEISKLASLPPSKYLLPRSLPRPMLHSKDFNFSFSGLKTAVLYLVRDLTKAKIDLTEEVKSAIAKEFQDAVVEVLVSKTIDAANTYKVKSLILGGGVAANVLLREELGKKLKKEIKSAKLYLPNTTQTGDNALMIALAAAVTGKKKTSGKILVKSNLRL